MIRVHQLNKSMNGKQVLSNISVDLNEGELVGLVGSSGSGKSTLLRCIALQDSWDSGDYTWNNTQIIHNGGRGTRAFRSKCAYLEQSPSFYMDKTALKNVLIGQVGQTSMLRRVTGMVRSDDYMGAMDELEKFGLLDKAHVPAGKLSGGERQRVAICRALVHGAKLIAADEPTLGLDPQSAERVLTTLRQLCTEQGVLVVTALSIELAERYCTRIIGMHQGELRLDVQGRRLTTEEKARIDLV